MMTARPRKLNANAGIAMLTEAAAGNFPVLRRNFIFQLVLLCIFILALTNPVRAEFKICNQTVAVYNVAIGAEKDHKFSTEGWWILPANGCISPLKEDLDAIRVRYVYVYATTVTGESAFLGNSQMCVDTKRFRIDKIPDQPWNCWVRGFEFVKFKEIDTGSAKSWTVFIRNGVSQ